MSGALSEPRFDARGNSNYEPVFPGLHLCGICVGPAGNGDAFGEQPYTALNLPARDDAEARDMWDAAKLEASIVRGEGDDFVCDLNLSDGSHDDYSTNRQLIPRLIAVARAQQKLS